MRIPDVTEWEFVLWLGPPLAVATFALLQSVRAGAVAPAVSVVLVASVLAAGGFVMADHGGDAVGFDVYLAHVAAASALEDGENPYSDAVRYPDGSPTAEEGAFLEGYSYPPVALWAYALTAWLTGDPRWLNLVAWAGVMVVLLWRLYRTRPDWVVLFALVLAVSPAWRLIVFSGWTEPLTIGLLVAAACAWRRSPVVSGILLGLALASKQYMILLAPLLLLHRDPNQVRRLVPAGAIAFATLVPYAWWDLGLLIDRLVLRPLSIGHRPDTQSLTGLLERVGLSPDIPVVVAIVAAIAMSWAASRTPRGPDTFLLAAAQVLGVFFLLSLGFANYWFLAAGLLVAGAAFVPDTRSQSIEAPP